MCTTLNTLIPFNTSKHIYINNIRLNEKGLKIEILLQGSKCLRKVRFPAFRIRELDKKSKVPKF